MCGDYIQISEIAEPLVIIKVNQLYRVGMNALELYEITRGIWKRTIKSVEPAQYALSAYKGTVIEVYRIDEWVPAGTYPMKTRMINPQRCEGRIEFVGGVAADDIRQKYIGRSIRMLFRQGEANPVKSIYPASD